MVVCATHPCLVFVDWAGGGAPTSVDRRYGAAAEFEDRLKARMRDRRMRLVDRRSDAAVVITVRPKIKPAMCDAMPGTNTDFSCRAFDDSMLQFDVSDSTIKPIKGLRVPNRCDSDAMPMDVARYSAYLASFIEWVVDLNPRKKRPAARC
jgi:hypothetical protein